MLAGKGLLMNGHDIIYTFKIYHVANEVVFLYMYMQFQNQLPVPPLLVQLPTLDNQLAVQFQWVSKASNPKLITLPPWLTYNFRLN